MAKNKSHGNQSETVFQSVFKALKRLLHFIAAVQFCYAIYYDWTFVAFPISDKWLHHPFGGKFKYLTFIDAIIQAFYFIVCLINDFVGTNEVAPKKMPGIRKLKDYLMAALAFPIALNVGITFWSLYAIDRELVFPRVLDAVFPSWLNHIMHTNIMVFIVLEMFTSFRAYPPRRKGMFGLTVFMLSYLVWIHIVKHFAGIWVYPVLQVLHFHERIIFFVAVISFTMCLYVLGEFMNNIIWAKELKLAQRKVK